MSDERLVEVMLAEIVGHDYDDDDIRQLGHNALAALRADGFDVGRPIGAMQLCQTHRCTVSPPGAEVCWNYAFWGEGELDDCLADGPFIDVYLVPAEMPGPDVTTEELFEMTPTESPFLTMIRNGEVHPDAHGLSAFRTLKNGKSRQYTAVAFKRGWHGLERTLRMYRKLGWITESRRTSYAILDVLNRDGDIIQDFGIPDWSSWHQIKRRLGLRVEEDG